MKKNDFLRPPIFYLKLKSNLFFLILFFISLNSFAQNYGSSWTKTHLNGMNGMLPVQIASDSFGNTIEVGAFNATITVGTNQLVNSGTATTNDIFIIKYNYQGDIVWSKKIGGTGNETINSITTDANDNIYLAGSFGSTTLNLDAVNLSKTGGDNLFVAKLNNNGTTVWAKTATATGTESATAIKTDLAGNVYFGGTFKDSTITFGNTILNNGGGTDIFVAKLDSSGNIVWAKNNSNGVEDDYLSCLVLDSDNNIYLAGDFNSTKIKIGASEVNNTEADAGTASTFGDGFIAKLDTDGNDLWIKTITGSKSEGVYDMAIDSNGALILSGYSLSPSLSSGQSTITGSKGYLTKLDRTTGNTTWLIGNTVMTYGYLGDESELFPKAIAVDRNNEIYVVIDKDTPDFDSKVIRIAANGTLKAFGLPYFDYSSYYGYNNYYNKLSSNSIVVNDFGISIVTFNNSINTYKFTKSFCGNVSELPSGFNWYTQAEGGTALDLYSSLNATSTPTNTTYYGARVVNGVENPQRIAYSFLINTNVFYRDADNDGYVNLNETTTSCSYTPPSGYKNYGYQDCNDNDPTKTISIALYPDTDNDGYGDHAANYTISCGPLAGYVTNNDDCDDTNANLHGAYYFADSDGDGYVTGDKILMCTDNNDPAYAAPPGYIAATYMFEQYSYPSNPHYADCNNQNPNINPGVQETYFNTIDDDCNGYIDDAKIITETITSNTSLISCTLVNGAQAYRFKVRFLLSNNPELTVSKTTNSFSLSQIGNKYSINEIYGISVALKKDGIWQDYGVEKRIDTQISTEVVSEQCGATITSLGNYVVNYTKIINAVGYQVWINNGKSNFSIYTTNNYFNFNSVPADFKKNNSKFAITIQTKGKNGVFYSGATCRLVVPIPIRNTATDGPSGITPPSSTSIQTSQCDSTIASLSTPIYATAVTGATLYRFTISGAFGNITSQSSNRFIRLNQITGFTPELSTTYNITVAVFKGVWSAEGTSCSITTPAPIIPPTPATPTVKIINNQCGHTITYLNSKIYSTLINKVTLTSFTFEITNNTTNETITYTTANRYFIMKELPVAGFGQYSTSYTIKVKASSNTTEYPFGDSCVVSTPAAPLAKSDATPFENRDVTAYGYPNPFAKSFTLGFNSNRSENVQIHIYDLMGREIESRTVKVDEISNEQFGDNYPSGIYLISLTQNEETQIIKMIKK